MKKTLSNKKFILLSIAFLIAASLIVTGVEPCTYDPQFLDPILYCYDGVDQSHHDPLWTEKIIALGPDQESSTSANILIDAKNLGFGTDSPNSIYGVPFPGARIFNILKAGSDRAILNIEGFDSAEINLVDMQAPNDQKWMVIRNDGGLTQFLPHDNNGARLDTTNPSLSIRHSDGHVGIGTVPDSDRLKVDGNIKVTGWVNNFNGAGIMLADGYELHNIGDLGQWTMDEVQGLVTGIYFDQGNVGVGGAISSSGGRTGYFYIDEPVRSDHAGIPEKCSCDTGPDFDCFTDNRDSLVITASGEPFCYDEDLISDPDPDLFHIFKLKGFGDLVVLGHVGIGTNSPIAPLHVAVTTNPGQTEPILYLEKKGNWGVQEGIILEMDGEGNDILMDLRANVDGAVTGSGDSKFKVYGDGDVEVAGNLVVGGKNIVEHSWGEFGNLVQEETWVTVLTLDAGADSVAEGTHTLTRPIWAIGLLRADSTTTGQKRGYCYAFIPEKLTVALARPKYHIDSVSDSSASASGSTAGSSAGNHPRWILANYPSDYPYSHTDSIGGRGNWAFWRNKLNSNSWIPAGTTIYMRTLSRSNGWGACTLEVKYGRWEG